MTGVIIGYVVYLTVSLFNGELLLNVMDFISIYLPWLEPQVYEAFPSIAERVTAASKHDSEVKRQTDGSDSLRSSKPKHTSSLFDDRASQVGHIVGADMSMSSGPSQPNYESTGQTPSGSTFADFGTGIRSSNVVS